MSLLTWLRDTFVTPPSVLREEEKLTWEPERVADPTPPLPAHVTVCGKCGSVRGDGWTYQFKPARNDTPVQQRHYTCDGWPCSETVTVCVRPEHILVTCRCGHRWLEQTSEVIQGKRGQDFLPFPSFMQAWEWLRAVAGYDESTPLSAASSMIDRARSEVEYSEEGRAMLAVAEDMMREAGVLP